MGDLDRFAKRTFATETHVITSNAVQWDDPPENPATDLRPDGYMRVVNCDKLTHLPQPWRSAANVDEIVVDLKMAGDHMDTLELEHACLRQQARQVQRLIKTPGVINAQTALWFAAPNLPEWLEKQRAPVPVAPGCYRLERAWFQLLWITANELPLQDELVPFLVARTGRALDEFVRWSAPRRPLPWLCDMLEYLPLSTAARDDLMPLMAEPQDDPTLEARRQYIIRYLFDRSPWYQNEAERKGVQIGIDLGLQKGLQKGLAPFVHMFERRLQRTLSSTKRAALAQQLDVLGPERLGDLVLESTPQQLGVWLDLATIR